MIIMLILLSDTDGMTQIYKPRKISNEKFLELIELNDGKKSLAFSTADLEAYELNDGRLLIRQTYDSSAVLYNSIELYVEMMDRVQPSNHVLNDYQSEILNLPKNIPEVMSSFWKRMNIEFQGKKLSEVSLELIEQKVNVFIVSHGADEIFFELMVFVGEYLRINYQCEWVVVPSQESAGTYEAYLRDKNGRMLNIWLPMLKRINKGQHLYLEVLVKNVISEPSFDIQKDKRQKDQ